MCPSYVRVSVAALVIARYPVLVLCAEEQILVLVYGDENLINGATGNGQPIARVVAVASTITDADVETIRATDLSAVLDTVPGLHIYDSSADYNPPVHRYTQRGRWEFHTGYEAGQFNFGTGDEAALGPDPAEGADRYRFDSDLTYHNSNFAPVGNAHPRFYNCTKVDWTLPLKPPTSELNFAPGIHHPFDQDIREQSAAPGLILNNPPFAERALHLEARNGF